MELGGQGNWWLEDPTNLFFQAAAAAIKEEWGQEPLYTREGATMSAIHHLKAVLNCPTLHLPFGQASDQAQLENERIRIENLVRGKKVFKAFIMHAASLHALHHSSLSYGGPH